MSTRSRSPSSRSTGRDTNSNDTSAVRRRVFIGNLSTDRATKNDVEELFSKFGAIESISLHNNFGFVQYKSNEGADEAVIQMHGKELFGKRVDVNLAGLRRKTQLKDDEKPLRKEDVVPPHMAEAGATKRNLSKERRRSRSPVHRSRGEHDDRYRRPLSPMSRYEELYRREDPHSRYGGYDPYDHYGPPSRDYPPPPAADYRRYERDYSYDPYSRRPDYGPPAPRRPAIDCEIISLSKEESRYAEEVEARLRSIGLVCNISYPPPDVPVVEAVDRVTRLGTLYAVVVAPQNTVHRSCTLNILHGTRQEHRNMPLDDCLSLVARNFDNYLKVLRGEPYRAPPPPAVYGGHRDPYPAPAPPVGETKNMSNEQLEEMIEKLRREKQQRSAAEPKEVDPQRRAELEKELLSLQGANQQPARGQDNNAYYNQPY